MPSYSRFSFSLLLVVLSVVLLLVIMLRKMGSDHDQNWHHYMTANVNHSGGYYKRIWNENKETLLSGSNCTTNESNENKETLLSGSNHATNESNKNKEALLSGSNRTTKESKGQLQFFDNEVIFSQEKMLNSSWIQRLKHLLQMVNNRGEVTITFASYTYIKSLLNWLIEAQVKVKPPIPNIIVICMDEELFRILDKKDIPSVHISPSFVFRNISDIGRLDIVWVMRVVTYRLINYLGYDVMSYDTDAILMQNPQPVFDQYRSSDIVSSAGTHPSSLSKIWGFTMCMGVIMFRSTPKTEELWNSIPPIPKEGFDDQRVLNSALDNCGMKWSKDGKNIRRSPISGVCKNGLKVTVLPYSHICRQNCGYAVQKRKSDLYIWHQLSEKTDESKVKAARGAGVWTLNWKKAEESASSNLKGTEWLASLTTR